MSGRSLRSAAAAGACWALWFALGCAGVTADPNVAPIAVNSGLPNVGYVNGVFTSVTLCVPGTAQCQVVSDVLVDTGSMGLRVLTTGAGGAFSLALPAQVDPATGAAIVECNGFVDGYTWGPVRLADLKIAGEQARSVPIQVIGDSGFTTVPTSCSSVGGPNEDSLIALSANGILGVGSFPQDCGGACAQSPSAAGTMNPGNVYYTCTAGGSRCQGAAVSVTQQVQNPVSLFSIDNNGVILQLPAVPAGGAAGVTGSLIFGIGTRVNNGLGSATVLTLDPGSLSFTTSYAGRSYPKSYIDSGSNALYLLTSQLTGIPVCADPNLSDFYCPTSGNLSLSATNIGTNGARSLVPFSVADAAALYATPNVFVFDDLAGPSGGDYFGWGLPFFFGRRVFTAIEGTVAPGGKTPYFAY